MKYAIKLFGDIDNPLAAPSGYPAVTCEVDDSVESMEGYRMMTQEQVDAAVSENATAYHEWAYVNCRPHYVAKLRDMVDENSRVIIEYGLMFQMDGQIFRIRCNDEDQRNYTGLIIAKDYLLYSGPDRIKLKGYDANGNCIYVNFTSPTDVVDMYMMGLQHVNNTLNDGWKIKDVGGTLLDGVTVIETPIINMNCEQLQSWVDPRVVPE
jgi:hypothetical protein